MPVTTYKGYSVPTPGTESGTWGTDLNANTFAVIDLNLGGTAYISVSNVNVSVTAAQAQNGILRIGGVLTANLIVSIPFPGIYAVRNETAGNFYVFVAGPVGTMKLLPQNTSTVVHIDAGIGAFLGGQRVSTVGMISAFAGVNAPGGWLICDGSTQSRTFFQDLWTYAQNSGSIVTDAAWFSSGAYGSFSSGDGTTNFRLPDLRGYFVRSWAVTGTVVDAGRVVGSTQQDGVANHVHPAGSVVTDPGHSHPNSMPANSGYNTVGGSTQMSNSTRSATNPSATGITVATTISNNIGGIAETRPKNIALVYCISVN